MNRLLLLCAFCVVLGAALVLFLAGRSEEVVSPPSPAPLPPETTALTTDSTVSLSGFLYGRVTRLDGVEFEGRLRFGGDEEALWHHTFNGRKSLNVWASHAPESATTERRPIRFLGLELASRERQRDLGRFFMARFGDLRRIEANAVEVRVTTKSGTVFQLDRLEASDFDDGLRIWDEDRGVTDLGSRQIRSIEFFAPPEAGSAPAPLFGRVYTRQAVFAGPLQWNRQDSLVTDQLDGATAEGPVSLPYDTIRSIARHGADGVQVVLRDGREMGLSGTRETGVDHRGVYVDDPRYGRVLVSWSSIQRVDLEDEGELASYETYLPGSLVTGSITLGDGTVLRGQLVYDLDESETTETLDAPAAGIHYSIPFGQIASLERRADADGFRLHLHGGESLALEARGDLGERNGGLLVFGGSSEPTYVAWSEFTRLDLDPPSEFDALVDPQHPLEATPISRP